MDSKGKVVFKGFRITEEQNKFIQLQCDLYGIQSESEYFRRLIDRAAGKPSNHLTKEEFVLKKSIQDEINKIGVNINQIVKNANSHYYTDYEKKKLFAMMEKIKELVHSLEIRQGGEK